MLISEIQAVVAHRFGTTVREMLSPTHSQAVSRARHVAMWLTRHFTDHSSPEIGRLFRRDHTSVLYAVKHIDGRMTHDRDLALTVAELRIVLGRGVKMEIEGFELMHCNDNIIKTWELRL